MAELTQQRKRVPEQAAIEAKFKALTESWQAQRGPDSSISRLSMHPAYQRIIGMGDAAVPLILRELERKPDHWFWALNAITGADPVPEASRGILREMAAAWLKWGHENGYR
ncbi:MAG: hypothetical protein JWN24_757 [Phycisphaerales bacterium]|nr:hypothetical protein [Phycisphaerales bacterium]